jgi:hypothetical protein
VFTPEQYRAKAAEYTELAKQGKTPNEVREFRTHERSLAMLADNKQWLTDNDDKLADNCEEIVDVPEPSVASEATLAAEEEHILRCLGAALIMQWNTLPTELQRVLFDNAGSMGELLDTAALRGQIARFLRRRTQGEEESNTVSSILTDATDHFTTADSAGHVQHPEIGDVVNVLDVGKIALAK